MSSILKGIQLNEVNPNNYDSDWDYQDAVARSGRSRSRSSDSYDAHDAENDAYEMHKRFAATRARKEAAAKAAAEKEKTEKLDELNPKTNEATFKKSPYGRTAASQQRAKDLLNPPKPPEPKKDEKGVAEGSGKNVVKSVKVGNFRHDLVDTGFGWQVRIYNSDELYDTGLSKNSEQKGLVALDNAVAYTKKQLNIKEQGVAEGPGGNWYIRVNGKILNDTKFKPVIFSSEDEARSHAMKLADKKHIPLSQMKLTKSWMDAPEQGVAEGWSQKYKSSINCSHPKGFSQKAHCAGKKKHNESIEMEMTCEDCGMCQTHGDNSKDKLDELKCWSGYHRVKGTTAGFPGSCAKNKTNEEQHSDSCPHCGGEMVSEELMNEKKDACYYKVKSRYKVWPSAYASGALVKCRNKGASNWGNSSKNESSILEGINRADESLHDWFNKEKWVRMDTKGNIKGPCAKEPGEDKPKCLPQSKAHSLGKKGRASAAARKRREDPNPDRSGKAINVDTKKKD